MFRRAEHERVDIVRRVPEIHRGATHVDGHLYMSKEKQPQNVEGITFRDCIFAIVAPVAHISIKSEGCLR